MKVLKFGGSSVGNADRIRNVKQIIDSQSPCIVVISAFEGVTDRLINLCRLACEQKDYKKDLGQLNAMHLELVNTLITGTNQSSALNFVNGLLKDLEVAIEKVYHDKGLSLKSQDIILSYGEQLSSYIIAQFTSYQLLDSRELIKTDSSFGNAQLDVDLTNAALQKTFGKINKTILLPGFIGSNAQNEITTLGRGGSDYTASVIAAFINAEVLEIWTNVDGFMTADPKMVSKAYAIEQMSYAEAIELSHFGAKVIYTPTIRPVYKKNIPILIKNTFNPQAKGTLITKETKASNGLIKGISSISDVVVITLQGAGMVGVPGTSRRLFSALAEGSINVILITQASSEFSITFAIRPEDTERATKAINEEFKKEISQNKELNILVEKELSIVAIVGEQMKNTPGISANLFRSLSRNGISVIATAQGSSELNISIVIKQAGLKKAMNAIHEGFFLSGYKELNVFLVGTGVIGGALLKQICKQQSYLLSTHKLKVNVVGIANIDKMLFNEKGIKLDNWTELMNEKGLPINMDVFVSKIKELNLRNSVFVDCTAHPDPASKYFELLSSFVSVVTPNKIACSSEYSHFKLLHDTAKARGVKYMYETNVGAGLPVINTINDLIISGDKILKIEAVLSGTLNFIFNTISAEIPLSKTILMAKEKGYSEPDPRIDLSGTDVVRKILILARVAGHQMEKEDVKVTTFLPAECFNGSLDDFWQNVKNFDASFEKRRKILEENKKRWRFVARLDNDKASVELIEVDMNHPAYVLEGSNNIIILTTERYKELPMVIKGYGAGADVTAAGIFADIIRCANL